MLCSVIYVCFCYSCALLAAANRHSKQDSKVDKRKRENGGGEHKKKRKIEEVSCLWLYVNCNTLGGLTN